MTTRALVLGGGGLTGIAWELGLLASLRDARVDLTTADRLVGTSAGAAVGAQIATGGRLEELVAAQHAPSVEIDPEFELETLVPIFSKLMRAGELGEREHQDVRAEIGAMALAAKTVGEDVRRKVIEARLPAHDWGDRDLIVTAVDAADGSFVPFDRSSGVELVDAVAASCAVPGVWPPVTIDGHRYVDGGMRSGTNADLASGFDVVVILVPLADSFGTALDREVGQLQADGSTVVVVKADADATEAFGANPLDPAKRSPAVEAGQRQGADPSVIATLTPVWSL